MRPSRKDIATAVDQALSKGASFNSAAKQTAAYLLSEHRVSDLNSIMRDVIAIRASRGDVEAEVVVAHELEPRIHRDLVEIVSSVSNKPKNILLNKKMDTSIIGGIKLNVIDKSLDLSVRAKLNKLKQMTI